MASKKNKKLPLTFIEFCKVNDRKFKQSRNKKKDIARVPIVNLELEKEHKEIDIKLENDELSPQEAGFLHGYIGAESEDI